MDEIHIKPYLDYKAGNIGAAYNTNVVAKTAFVFMIKSFLSSFKEVTHILPVRTINGEELYSYLKKLLNRLHEIGYKVLWIISDNNAIIVKLFHILRRRQIYLLHIRIRSKKIFHFQKPVKIYAWNNINFIYVLDYFGRLLWSPYK